MNSKWPAPCLYFNLVTHSSFFNYSLVSILLFFQRWKGRRINQFWLKYLNYDITTANNMTNIDTPILPGREHKEIETKQALYV